MNKENWICGKCYQVENNSGGEIIPEHFRTCPKHILNVVAARINSDPYFGNVKKPYSNKMKIEIEMEKHIHVPTEFGGENCSKCQQNWRHEIHHVTI